MASWRLFGREYASMLRLACEAHGRRMKLLLARQSGRLKWTFDISKSKDLQCLGYIEVVDKWKFNTGQLINLKELYVVVTRKGPSFDLDSIGQLKSLQTLYLKVVSDILPDLDQLAKCTLLIQLKLKGKIKKLPKGPKPMHEIFPNLMYLYLDGSEIEEDPMPKLEMLPKLTILDLYRYMREEIKLFSATGFPQLEIFQLIKCKELKVEADDGGMPLLKGIKVPEGISIPEKFKSIPAPKHWGNPHDDDWPYYPRSRQ